MQILSYIIAVSSILITLLFFKIWESGKYYKVAIISMALRLLLIPLFELYGNSIVPAELPELLQWYSEWQSYTELEGFENIIINPFSVNGPRGMYLYYTLYAGWFLDWTKSIDMVPLRILTASTSLYIIVFASNAVKWMYNLSLTAIQIFIIANWPFWLYYSTMLGRTMPSVIIPLIGILALYQLMDKFTVKGLIVVLITFWLTLILRTFYSFFFLTTLTSFALYKIFLENSWKEKIWQKNILILSFILGIIFMSKIFSIDDTFGLIVDGLLESDQVEGESSGSAYLTGVYPQKIADLLYYMPLQGFYFLFSPMLWNVYKIDQLMSSIFSLIMLILLYKMITTKDNIFYKNKRAKIFVLNMILISLILGSGVKNAGAAQRWRLPITCIVLCVALPNIIKNKQKI